MNGFALAVAVQRARLVATRHRSTSISQEDIQIMGISFFKKIPHREKVIYLRQ